MRILRESARPLSLEELGLTGSSLALLKQNIQRSHGLILVTGPTGSGKTTTLYSVLNMLNTIKVKICTVEDPVEYAIKRVSQVHVNTKTGLTFASGLRALLRHDPNIIMVGEIRDGETVDMAIHSALTGHLVLSSLHTNSAAGAIPRLIDMGAEPFLVSSTLNIIVAQRLVRRLSEEKDAYKLSDKEIADLSSYCSVERVTNILQDQKLIKPKQKLQDVQFWRPKATKDNPDGYKGRLGIYEVLPVTETIKALIIQRSSADSIGEQAQKEGMVTMVEDGFVKAAQGITSIEEVLR